jgi:hypothetical protein
MPDTAHATTGADREALAILAEAKRRDAAPKAATP